MRQVFLDTETTGLEPALGHRIVELAAVEIVSRRLTGKRFHRYLNPEREIDAGALSVHGITREFLQGQPRFRDIAAEFLEFVKGAEIVIHNASFDIGFLEHELKLAELGAFAEHCGLIVDTLTFARELHPGKKNSLDALCERYQVDRSARTLHGALTDALLLCDVYIAMTRGQESLAIDFAVESTVSTEVPVASLNLIVLEATLDEVAAHARALEEIARRGPCLWQTLEQGDRSYSSIQQQSRQFSVTSRV